MELFTIYKATRWPLEAVVEEARSGSNVLISIWCRVPNFSHLIWVGPNQRTMQNGYVVVLTIRVSQADRVIRSRHSYIRFQTNILFRRLIQ